MVARFMVAEVFPMVEHSVAAVE